MPETTSAGEVELHLWTSFHVQSTVRDVDADVAASVVPPPHPVISANVMLTKAAERLSGSKFYLKLAYISFVAKLVMNLLQM